MDTALSPTALNDELKAMAAELCPPLQIHKEGEEGFELAGRKPVLQGKQKVEGHYFANTVIKPKDLRFYFFPIYTHPDDFQLSEALQKALKGKSCFHLKNLGEAERKELDVLMRHGVTLYQKEGLI